MATGRRARLALQALSAAGTIAVQRVRAKVRRTPPVATSEVLTHRFDTFITWHDRPKTVTVSGSAAARILMPETAIVIQGAVVEESDFTLETVRMYRAFFPDASVIVSTWNDTDADALTRIADAGARLVVSEAPDNRGNHNQNMQLVSASAGIRAARDAGAEYVVKSRTDQRMYAPSSLPMMHALINAFPLREPISSQQARIVTSDQYTYKFLLYGAGDQLNFGRTEDMLTYWSPAMDERDPALVAHMPAGTARQTSVRRLHEAYFGAEFLEATGWELTWTLRDWWSALAERFVIFDATAVDRYWPKYTMREYPHRQYGQQNGFELFHFADWMALAADPEFTRIVIPEARLDEPLTA